MMKPATPNVQGPHRRYLGVVDAHLNQIAIFEEPDVAFLCWALFWERLGAFEVLASQVDPDSKP